MFVPNDEGVMVIEIAPFDAINIGEESGEMAVEQGSRHGLQAYLVQNQTRAVHPVRPDQARAVDLVQVSKWSGLRGLAFTSACSTSSMSNRQNSGVKSGAEYTPGLSSHRR